MCLERYRTIKQYISRNPGCTVRDIEAYFEFGVSYEMINNEVRSLMNNGKIVIHTKNNVRYLHAV